MMVDAFFNYDGDQRVKILSLVKKSFEDANDIDYYFEILEMLDEASVQSKKAEQKIDLYSCPALRTDEKGRNIKSIDNFLEILLHDNHFSEFKYNVHANKPERVSAKGIARWEDADDAGARLYIERNFGLHSKEKYDDAMRIFAKKRSYHPIIDRIKATHWDGVERIPTMLQKYMRVEDSAYSREVSRLIFAGGINRIMEPGCKFDDMPVLIGQSQGEGKSTFCRWLAMDESWFAELKQFEGESALESLDGAWVCEVGELLALTKIKEQEAVKAFITCQNDRRRLPYDRRISDHPRQCVFIGTTNKAQFLTDKTGNRRFYPVTCHQVGYELFKQEEECRKDIEQCWAEAYHKYLRGEMPAFADQSLSAEIKDRQSEAVEDDYREGLILEYLNEKTECCIFQIWEEALGNTYGKPDRKESAEIALILQGLPNWEREKRSKRVAGYGVQKVWSRTNIENGFYPMDF